jgi:hypothetical protein
MSNGQDKQVIIKPSKNNEQDKLKKLQEDLGEQVKGV